ncbi:Hypothetical protein RG1141_PA05520 (plasmid) [Neorhizobium galegae bv. officinalis bv. officinalis str. HAMBI 1141]|uniref:Glycine-rich cell wall protein n=1 Tax=Neorhizobium galegae bv. officinalis bv. officinalis str. HAMBI 1141 TaxID=1028801 RepID=A0A068TG31_NEOGA|nr:hypothetical protein [Neorhizobium galegae]CDN57387.1 Hypothetical protein RG1141_PA05520 [Neorhizobium galegae bv. officinalis bv. officinalis str. HAMBI 1141]
MPTRRMLVLSGALTAVIAAVLPWKVVAGADGLPRIALSTVAAKDGNGDGGSGNGGGSSSGNGSDNGGSSGNNGNGSSNGNSGGNGNAGGTDTGSTGSGTGPGPGAGSAPAGEAVNPGKAAASPAQPAAPAPSVPAAPSKAGVEVDVRGTSITVRHHNGATERISQGRYEMRDSQSRTIVNRTATPSDTSRLRSFGR